jgi:hypothetical protein
MKSTLLVDPSDIETINLFLQLEAVEVLICSAYEETFFHALIRADAPVLTEPELDLEISLFT